MEVLQILAPVIGPLVVALLKRFMPDVPGVLQPVLATIAGAVAAYFGGADLASAAALGGSGVAVREVLDQARK